ncbi:MAG: hypothetical protein J6A97_09425 [Clostridia bacterium]|nr:hypothetical protein [Clostridia bacterium]
MKKIFALILTLTLTLSFAACGTGNEETTAENGDTVTNPTADALLSDGELDTGMKEKFDQMEYSAYIDLFYNDNGASYEGKTFSKDGTFAVLQDAYSNVTRYYVWGYADNTKCCDYQWEFVMPDGMEIPEPGSYVKVKGTMEKNEAALDGYWLKDVTLEVTEEFKNAGFGMDMTTMSPTLVRVQVINILQFPDNFKDMTVRVFGRALSVNSIQHPYYNESWSMHFTETDTVPAIGKYILLEGTYNNKQITTDKLTVIG